MTPALHADKMKLEQHCIYYYASDLWDLHRGQRITGWVNRVTPQRSMTSPVSKESAHWTSLQSQQRLHKGHPVLTAVQLLMDVDQVSLDSTCRLWFLLNDGSVQFHQKPRVNRAGYHQLPPLYCRYPWQPGQFFVLPKICLWYQALS